MLYLGWQLLPTMASHKTHGIAATECKITLDDSNKTAAKGVKTARVKCRSRVVLHTQSHPSAEQVPCVCMDFGTVTKISRAHLHRWLADTPKSTNSANFLKPPTSPAIGGLWAWVTQ